MRLISETEWLSCLRRPSGRSSSVDERERVLNSQSEKFLILSEDDVASLTEVSISRLSQLMTNASRLLHDQRDSHGMQSD